MTKTDFLGALCWELSLRGVPHIYIDVAQFVDDVWPLAEEDADVGRWTEAFREHQFGAAGKEMSSPSTVTLEVS
jgi:hypothetical protein